MQSNPKTPDITDYDKSGYDYTKYWENRQYEDEIERLILKSLIPVKSQVCLDLGGGFGRLMDVYSPKCDQAMILDYSNQLLKTAQKTAQEKGYHNLQTIQGDIYNLPFDNQSIDLILMVRVLHHIEKPEIAFKEIARVLKPNGVFILEMANKIHLKAVLKAWLKGNFSFTNDLTPLKHSHVKINQTEGIFYNFHPQQILGLLKEEGLNSTKIISGSNLRIPYLKEIIPLSIYLNLEKLIQPIFTKNFWGPSIWIKSSKN